MEAMAEPYETEFRRLLDLGAGACDVHGAKKEVGFARRTRAKEAFARRELARVRQHAQRSCRLLEEFAAPARRILEVGCSTGGLSVALAQSSVLAAHGVVGVDPDALSLQAAEVRARGHGLGGDRIAFLQNHPGHPLPLASEAYDLVLCVSVLEFVPTADERKRLIDEMKRVLKPGGYLFLSTPNPLRLRDLHAERWLGDFIRRDGYPWATPPWVLRAMVSDLRRVPIDRWVIGSAFERLGVPIRSVPGPVARAIVEMHRWQKLLIRKPPVRRSDRSPLTGPKPVA
jgi:2-polyprenyl-3-methyl-5-hydroxy-6-metoxy-1,4-benzoquinol methylase